MPFLTPSYSQLQATAIAEILASGQVPNGLLPVSILRVLAQCIAENAYLHTEFLRWISLQSVPFTCTDEYLDSWAALVGVFRYPSTASTTVVIFSGTNGTLIPTGTTVQRVGDSIAYQTTGSTNIASGVASAPAIATTTGSITNGAIGLAAVLNTPITGISSSATLAAASGGADPETDPDLRTRMLAAFAAVGSAGSISDFTKWAFETVGVSRVWINPWGYGIGTILIYIMLDTQNAANNGFPIGTNGVSSSESRWPVAATGDQLRCANVVFPLQPIASLVFVATPMPQHITVKVTSVSTQVTTAMTANLLAALQSYLLSIASPLGCTVYLSGISSAVQSVVGAGVTFDIISPAIDTVLGIGYLPLITSADVTLT